ECQSKAETGEECLMDHHCWNDERCIDRDGSGPDGDTCGEPGQEGTPCANYLDCQDDMFCDTSDAEASACKPKLPIGQPCDVYGSCVAGAFCNQETGECQAVGQEGDRKSTRLNSSHVKISYAVFSLTQKKENAMLASPADEIAN